MLYIAILLYIIFLIYKYDIKRSQVGINNHYGFLLIIFILISGLSYRLGVDVIRYENRFFSDYDIPAQSLFTGYDASASTEYLWQLINWAVYQSFGEFYVMKIILSVFVNSTIFWFVKKYSPAIFTSILFYAVLAYFELNFEALRESMSISFFLIAIDRLISAPKRKILKYYLWIIPALLCHRFAFITLIFPILTKINFNRGYVIFLLFALISLPYISSIFESFVNINVLNYVLNERIDSLLTSETYGLHSRNFFGIMEIFIIYIVPLIIIVSVSPKNEFQSLSLVYIVVVLLKTSAFVILYRINNYLAIPLSVSLASGLNQSLYHKELCDVRTIFIKSPVVLCLLLVVFLFYTINGIVSSELFAAYYPYSSIFTKSLDAAREAYYSTLIHF